MREALAEQTSIPLGADLGWSSGTIVLGRIEINIPNDLAMPVPREPLIEQVRNKFELLTKEHVNKLAAISGTRPP